MLVLVAVDEEIAAHLRTTARERNEPPPVWLASAESLMPLLQGTPAEPLAVVLGPDVPAPLRLARTAKARRPLLPFIILSKEGEKPRIEHELLLTPFPGEPVRCIGAGEGALKALQEHVERCNLQRRQRALMHRLNEQLAAAEPPRPRAPPFHDRLLEVAPVGILLLDPAGRIVRANHAATEALGIAAGQRGERFLDLFPRTEHQALRELLDKADAIPMLRVEHRAESGAPRVFEALASRVMLTPVQPGMMVVLRDVTELEAARRELAHTEKLTTMGGLVGGLAHEIRTPLTAIGNHLAMARILLAKDPAGLDEKEARAVDAHLLASEESVHRINQLVKDLRRFIQGKAGELESTDLARPVEDAVRLFRSAYRGNVEVASDLRSTPAIPLDPLQVQQLTVNLLQNAVEASPPHGATVHVRVQATPENAELVVEDHGSGISPAVQARMFEAFVTTKPNGNGLGLSIVRRIVEAHGGTIRCESEEGKGTRFRVLFPLAPQRDG